MKEIHKGLVRCLEEEKRAVLATIVQVTGSAYRREGARCLIYETGEVVGILSGGCVEEDLVEHARSVLRANLPKKVEYDFRWTTDEIWGLGLGCNGIIMVLLEPIDPINDREKTRSLIKEFRNRAICEVPYFTITVVESSNPKVLCPGKHWTQTEIEFENDKLDNVQCELIEEVIDGVSVALFVEKVNPLPRLVIVGSGPDAALLATRAQELEWRVSVVDHRSSYLNSYFSGVETILIKRGDYASVDIHQDSFAVIMTHNLDLDQLAIRKLLPLNLSYVGVLGSRERIRKITELIRDSDEHIDLRQLENVYSPVGLDIGAETPEEITLSILSELTAHKNRRVGGSLRDSRMRI